MLRRRVRAGEVDLEVAEAGAGGRPILLLHGFTGAKEDLGGLFAPLATAGWHVVAPDLRGHGKSDQPQGESSYSLEIFAADALALADTLGWARFVVLGYSMGGMVAQRLLLDDPGRIRAAVLMDTSHGVPDGLEPALVELGADVVRREGLAALAALQDRLRDRAVAQSPGAAAGPSETAGSQARTRSRLVRSSPDMWLAMTREMVFQPDRLDALARLSMPVLIIVGERDWAFVGHGRRMAAAIPGARLAVIEGAGHAPQLENAPACWEALRSFLDDLG